MHEFAAFSVPLYPGCRDETLPGASGWESLEHIGPMARSVRDIALILAVLAGPSQKDRHSLPAEPGAFDISPPERLRGARIAFSADLGFATVDREVASFAPLPRAALSASGLPCCRGSRPPSKCAAPSRRRGASPPNRTGLRRLAAQRGMHSARASDCAETRTHDLLPRKDCAHATVPSDASAMIQSPHRAALQTRGSGPTGRRRTICKWCAGEAARIPPASECASSRKSRCTSMVSTIEADASSRRPMLQGWWQPRTAIRPFSGADFKSPGSSAGRPRPVTTTDPSVYSVGISYEPSCVWAGILLRQSAVIEPPAPRGPSPSGRTLGYVIECNSTYIESTV